jgi:hypothetical protein
VLHALAPNGNPDSDAKASFERRRMLDIMERVAWDADRAATLLGVHRTTVYRRLRRLGMASSGQAVAETVCVDGVPPVLPPVLPPAHSATSGQA